MDEVRVHSEVLAGHPFVAAAHDHDDTLEAHYASLERMCACLDGWVFLGRVVESEHDLDGQVVEYIRVPCRRCAEEASL